ncbi:TPA: hypothetical protein DEO28_03725 [Candidatus Dependentiae bacterium]|nr:MAG: hypothetical protein UR14_C0007G0046 [candidate division TM6 bacterium GW2011_GWE2_31_21]KKP53593.1 MAG: hypothetical protein UR43_C0004G0134 [candidate division TM6 bacterium GW2011_GWF2_33_332]HBS48167.1 hypothetical protein [Candidatus Dependentiae bacterium]HBZ73591.1 hypothetical protein [Candidatus Dependentiae bacterium]
MFISYTLKKFYKNFFILLMILMLVLSFGDMLVRLTLLPSMDSIPKLILLMIPLISIYAIPISIIFSTFITIGQIYQKNEILLFYYLPKIRRDIRRSLAIFILSITPLYGFLVFDFAPKCYQEGKEFIVRIAKDHIGSLDAGRFHYPSPNFVIFFKNKINNFDGTGATKFYNLFLTFQDDKNQRFIMTAAQGNLKGEVLKLYNGTIQNQNYSNNYLMTFCDTEILVEQLLGQKGKNLKNIQDKHTKFLNWNDIRTLKDSVKTVNIEFHCRIAKIFWLFILPFLALMILSIFGTVGSSNLVLGVLGTLFLFLISYLHVNIAKIFWNFEIIGFLATYGFIFLITFLLWCVYRTKKNC